ncbi:MAG: pullulanase X25 domain-containing protein, partial [Candidatus Xenobia bacterium]
MSISVPGSFNDWNPADAAVRAEEAGRGRYVYTRRLNRGVHRFKFAADGGWTRNWGANGTPSVMAPCGGQAVEGGPDLLLNAVDPGTYTFTFDLTHQRWSVDVAPEAGGLAGALSHLGSQGRLKTLLSAVGASNGAGPSALVVESLLGLLAESAPSGMLPLRGDGKVLFAYPAQPHERVQVAASWRGWADNLLYLHPVPGTQLHLQLADAPAGVHPYKVIYNGGWMADLF